jgi:hypothetical protein
MTGDDNKDQSDLIERQKAEILRLNNDMKELQTKHKRLCEQLKNIMEQKTVV